jgi:hypothetical protein
MPSPTRFVTPARPSGYGLFYLRAFVSIMMIALLVLFTVSGLALFAAPAGQMANTIGWRLAGLDKGQWEALHVAFGFVWIPLAVLHLVFNRRVVTGYLRDRVKRAFVWRRELVVATIVTGFLGVAAVLDLPPVAQLMAWEESFTDFWAERSPTVITVSTQGDAGGGMGRYATLDPVSGRYQPVGKEAAARLAALEDAAADELE